MTDDGNCRSWLPMSGRPCRQWLTRAERRLFSAAAVSARAGCLIQIGRIGARSIRPHPPDRARGTLRVGPAGPSGSGPRDPPDRARGTLRIGPAGPSGPGGGVRQGAVCRRSGGRSRPAGGAGEDRHPAIPGLPSHSPLGALRRHGGRLPGWCPFISGRYRSACRLTTGATTAVRPAPSGRSGWSVNHRPAMQRP
jgi:hypothetical protein